jgi:predicted PhzF superfamily epimerase YddE/YHI9
MTTLHVLSVFTDDHNRHGNALGVFLDGAAVPSAFRQQVAARLGFSETVFVDDAATGSVEICTPTSVLPFAGHPLVGTSWLLSEQGRGTDVLRPPAGEVPTWHVDGLTWIRGRAAWAPEMELRRFPSPSQVDALDDAPDGLGFVDCWSWIDEVAGIVRCRVFASDFGIAEDEATGAAAVRLADHLGRALTIHQGDGSVIRAHPEADGSVAIGGRVVLDDVRNDPGR